MHTTLASLLLLALGIVILIVSGDFLVRGAAALARKWGIPALIVGLTIVAFGTSAPELVVAVQAVLKNASELAIGNVVGSNIANVLLVLGLPAILIAIPTDIAGAQRNALVAVFATVLLIIFMFMPGPLVFWQGAVLFSGIVLYLIWMFTLAKKGADDPTLAELTELDDMEGMPDSMVRIALYIILGIIGLTFGGDMIVDNATELAQTLGISEAVIGLSIVAIGTSLPELATVILAAYRGHPDVAIGNVLGSNVFNIFAVTGAAAMAGNISVPDRFLVFDVWVMLASIVALLVYVLLKAPIGRFTGLVFMSGYILYMLAIASREVGTSVPM